LHPYSIALQAAGTSNHVLALREEPLDRPNPSSTGDAGCALAGRCPFAIARCSTERPELRTISGQDTACHRAEELADVDDLPRLITSAGP
jgi:ABC-type dipeptide/oligopeptide/nickel transport system ATPase component